MKMMMLGAVASMLPAVAMAAGVIETAMTQGQAAITATLATVIVATAFGFLAGRIDTRAKVALAKSPAERTLTDKLAIEADRRLDEIDRGHLTTVVDNVLSSRIDKVAATIGLPPLAAADDFVDDFFADLRSRNPGLADRLPLGPEDVKKLIAAGIGRMTGPDVLAAALRKAGVPGVVAQV